MWGSNSDDRQLQVFVYKPEDLREPLRRAEIGRTQYEREVMAEIRDALEQDAINDAIAYQNERVWWRLWIKRSRINLPPVNEIQALTPKLFQKIVNDCDWYYADGTCYDHVVKKHGALGGLIQRHGVKARMIFRDKYKRGTKWVREWRDLAERLQGPPWAETIELAPEIVDSMMDYASLVKPLEA